jgi:type II secretory pathway pseudopilin PulG
MSNLLKQVARARERRHKVCAQAQADYLQAVRAAREAGHTLPEIGDAAGVSKQRVFNMLNEGKGQT